MQTEMDFTTGSKLNRKHLTGQNKLVYDILSAGKTLTTLDAIRRLNITALHSRISDLRNKVGVVIYDRYVTVRRRDGGPLKVKEYSMYPFSNKIA